VLDRAKEDLIMLVELSMVEQRYLAVREVLDSAAAVNDVATRYGVSRKTLHRWLVLSFASYVRITIASVHIKKKARVEGSPNGGQEVLADAAK